VNAGLVLQVDDAVLANMYDHLVSQGGEAHYQRWASLRVDALNHALRGIPEERIRYHICFGSWHVPHVADAPLDAIVNVMLQVNAGAYSIEAANVRHEHEWRVWQHVTLPKGGGSSPVWSPPHHHCRAPAPRRGSPGPVCQSDRQGQPDGWHRLRVRADRRAAAGAPAGDVGQARRAGGRRSPCIERAVAMRGAVASAVALLAAVLTACGPTTTPVTNGGASRY
jgi:hypothetical protein